MRVHPTADTKFANQLTTLAAIVDRGDWLLRGFATREDFFEHIDACGIIGNPNIDANFIDSHDWCRNWMTIGDNPNITITWLEKWYEAQKFPVFG